MPSSPFLMSLHRQSMKHREIIEASRWCGCFFCMRLFPPSRIRQWADKRRTALCPLCGIDAVLGESGMDRPLTLEILQAMNDAYFVSTTSGRPTPAAGRLLGSAHPVHPQAKSPACVDWGRMGMDEAPAMGIRVFDASLLLPPEKVIPRILSGLPWAQVACAVALLVMGISSGPGGRAGLALVGAVVIGGALAEFRNALCGYVAIRRQQWRKPCVNAALGLQAGLDLAFPQKGDALLIEAQDWARLLGGGERGPAWEALRAMEGLARNEDLRRFILMTKGQSRAIQPYCPGEPL